MKYWDGSRVEAEGRMARSEEDASPSVGCNDRATPPAALLPRAVNGCVDLGVGLRCSLGRDHCGYRHCASRLGQRQNLQQRDPSQYFNSHQKQTIADPAALDGYKMRLNPFVHAL